MIGYEKKKIYYVSRNNNNANILLYQVLGCSWELRLMCKRTIPLQYYQKFIFIYLTLSPRHKSAKLLHERSLNYAGIRIINSGFIIRKNKADDWNDANLYIYIYIQRTPL